MILVTGANGFVGKAFADRFSLNPRRTRLATRNLSHFKGGIETCAVGDIGSNTDWTEALVDVSVVVHTAARVHVVDDDAADPITSYRQVNVAGTLNLARQAAEVGVRRFLFVSSIKVNGEATELGHPFTASDVPAPQDPYGISKMEAEQGLLEISAQTGMEVVIIRPPLIYGHGVKANFASMMRWLERGIPLPLGGVTTNQRSLVYVENLVDLISVCVDHPKAANQTFLVSDGADVSTTTLLRKMSNALGRPARLVNISPTIIKLTARLIGKPGITDRLCGSLQVDITKTKELLGWKPKFSIDEGLLQTARRMVSGCNK